MPQSAGATFIKKYLKNKKDPNKVLTPLVDQFMITKDLAHFTKAEAQFAMDQILARKLPRQKQYYSPSGASKCVREQYLTVEGWEPQLDENPRTNSLFDDGHWRHLRWHTIFLRMARYKLLKVHAIESYIEYLPWWVAGTPDDVIEIDREMYVVDIKGANDQVFREIARTGKLPEHLNGYVWQLHNYMQCLKINKGILWFENKNNQEYLEVRVNRDLKVVAQLRAQYKVLRKHRNSKTLPPHGCSMDPSGHVQLGDKRFRWCRQKLNCLKLTKEGK
jgi:hypothetical protein